METTISKTFVVDFWGKLACFSATRPERMSYPIATPSAARGMMDAIYRHAGMYWQIDRIEMHKPLKFIDLPFNGTAAKIPKDAALRWMLGTSRAGTSDRILTAKTRQQIMMVALEDVYYRVYAHGVISSKYHECDAHTSTERRNAFEAIAGRYIEEGRSFYQPYLGIKEMVAFWQEAGPNDGRKPVNYTTVIPGMTYSIFDLSTFQTEKPAISRFNAKVIEGAMDVPPYGSTEVFKTQETREAYVE